MNMKRSRPTRAITFDVYGTLIDWESGMWEFIEPFLRKQHIRTGRKKFLSIWEPIQWDLNHGPYKRYRRILAESFRTTVDELGGECTVKEAEAFADGMGSWKPFADTVQSLKKLKNLYVLAPITNTDDAFIEASSALMGNPFHQIITAQQARAYKPNVKPFHLALKKLDIPADEILHVGFGYRYDLGPAAEVGMKTAWLNRSTEKLPRGFQADFQFDSMDHLVRMACKPC